MSTRLNSLEKGLLIVSELASQERPLEPSEIAAATGLNRSTVYRLCEVLERSGWLAQASPDAGRRPGPYDIGFAAHGFAARTEHRAGITATINDATRQLARTLEETVHAGVLDQTEVVHVARALPDDGPNMAVRIGARSPAHATGLGKAMLAALPRQEVEARYAEETLPAAQPNSIRTRAALFQVLDQVAETGYAFDDEEARSGVRCLAAPIFSEDGHPLCAISITTLAVALDGRRRAEVAEAVIAAAALATATLGGRPPERWHPLAGRLAPT
ncbi:MAG: IclR family transcriptional regulator, acetate operon repressor [Thermoleophilaceae bacterium]|nr:IclR family transcriptional regulator, acetate operon repressor [Thermoleophilaceae bacterium]